MSGSRNGRDYTSMFWAGVLLVFVVGLIAGVGLLVRPKIHAMLSPPPVVDLRPLVMTNAEMNSCVDELDGIILPDPRAPGNAVPAMQALAKSGVVSEVDGLMQKAGRGDIAFYWTWTSEVGLRYTIMDKQGERAYDFNVLCWTDTGNGMYPLFESVIVRTP